MNSWKVILASLVIFGTGVVTGGLLVDHTHHARRALEHEAVRTPPEIPMPKPIADRIGKQLIQTLNDKLQLTQEQKEKIQKIVADGQDRNHAIWTNVAPQMRAVIQDVHQQIREQLTPEQKEQFEELLKHPPMQRKSGSTNAPPVKPLTPETPTNSPAAAIKKNCA